MQGSRCCSLARARAAPRRVKVRTRHGMSGGHQLVGYSSGIAAGALRMGDGCILSEREIPAVLWQELLGEKKVVEVP